MSRIETRLALAPELEQEMQPIQEPQRIQLLALAYRLVQQELSFELRLEIAFQIRGLLNGLATVQNEQQTEVCQSGEWVPPPSLALSARKLLD